MTTKDRDPVAHTQALIRCPSVTPDQAGALDYIERHLAAQGFRCHRLVFGGDDSPQVDNLYARIGDGHPHLCFAGHVDVVPPGNEADWSVPPFSGEIRDDILHGRGAVDMKSGVAAMMTAALRYLDDAGGKSDGSISFLITADEEGPARYGTKAVVEWMAEKGERPDLCIVGEPSCPERLGEAIKIGRRGSLSVELSVRGTQGHVAYPDRTRNPVPGLVTALQAILGEHLDEGSENFAPSNLEITSLDTSSHTINVVPAIASAAFNIRFNDHWTAETLEARLRALIARTLEAIEQDYTLQFESNADVFLTQPGPWLDALAAAITNVTGLTPTLSTSGGTSDARFIKDICPVIEFGLVNKTIHAVNERVPIADIEGLTRIYAGFLQRYLASAGGTIAA
jgi:succinyl-diaminopimelate desuccinylase